MTSRPRPSLPPTLRRSAPELARLVAMQKGIAVSKLFENYYLHENPAAFSSALAKDAFYAGAGAMMIAVAAVIWDSQLTDAQCETLLTKTADELSAFFAANPAPPFEGI